MIVQKYGGVCLETPERIKQVAQSVAALARQERGVIVVVSAMGKTTDDLVRLAYQVSPHPDRRELDMLLTTGERISMALMGMALNDLGCRAISFTGSQAGVMTDGSHSDARIVDVRPIRLQEELDRGRVIVLAGFQGVDPVTKEITTLGRGGTDTTAVAMAAKFHATRCEIIKEVDGVCSADPKIVPGARTWPRLTYAALREMCFWGAKVLHYRSIALAEEQQVKLVIKKWGSPLATEILQEDKTMENCKILSINSHSRIEQLQIEAPHLNAAFAQLDEHLSEHRLPRPQILSSSFDHPAARVVFAGDADALDALLRTLQDHKSIKTVNKALSSISITCHGSVATDLGSRVMLSLASESIFVDQLLFTPMTITVCVPPEQRDRAIQTLHKLMG